MILLVDSDSAIVSLLNENLQSEGYGVVSVASAEDALTLPLDSYNLVISEVKLPGEIDGLELLDRMKDDRLTAHVPLMFCTTLDGENDIIAGLNAGADDYVTRPFSPPGGATAQEFRSGNHSAHHRIPHSHPQHRFTWSYHRWRFRSPLPD